MEDFNILYKGYIRPHLEYAVQAWSPHLRKDIDCLETIPRRATKMVHGMMKKSYAERLKILDLTILEKRRQRGDLIEMYKILTDKENLDSASFFMKIRSDHDLRGHSLKLFKARFQSTCRQYSFSQRVIDIWNR